MSEINPVDAPKYRQTLLPFPSHEPKEEIHDKVRSNLGDRDEPQNDTTTRKVQNANSRTTLLQGLEKWWNKLRFTGFELNIKFRKLDPQQQKIAKRYEMAKNLTINGSVGALGSNAHFRDINYNDAYTQNFNDSDLPNLSVELSKLRQTLGEEAENLDHHSTIAEVEKAESAAKEGNGPKALEHLKNTTYWALKVSEKIGTSLATEALKTAFGL